MTELTFAILKYGFVIALWLFAWMVARSLHRDITSYLPSSKKSRGKRKRDKSSVMVGSAAPVHVATSDALQQVPQPRQTQSAAVPAPEEPSTPTPQRNSVLPTIDDTPNGLPTTNEGENSASLAGLAASVGPAPGTTSIGNGDDASTVAGGVRAGADPSLLIVIDGPLAGATVPLTGKPITLGRGTSNTVVLDDEFVSSSHARVFLDAETHQWMLEDLSSTNGTYVNESRINGIMTLPARVPVRIGATTFELR